LLVVATAFGAAACSDDEQAARNDGVTKVVAAFFPFAEAGREVGGRGVEVVDLTPAGGEPHDLEITPKQVDEIATADVVLVMGRRFQPAVEDVAKQNRGTIVVLDHLPVRAGGRDVEHGLDPHVWLDPTMMRRIVDLTAGALARADTAHAAAYRSRAETYDATLDALDREYRTGLAHCERRTIFTSHAAFAWLAARYGLRQQSIAGTSPDAEPSAERIATLADEARRAGATTIFTEPLVSSSLAKTLAREAGGLRTAALDPLESLTPEQRAAGATYVSVMRGNLAALRSALGCR
jgi:zinc transport system substrate-binding protein